MADTAIEWAEKVWNPTTGCDRVSPGCDNCYALTLAKRLKGMGSAKYQRDGDPRTSGPGFGLTVHEDALALPLTWRQPKRIFVNSMSDLFHDEVPTEFIAEVFAVMALAPQHTFQLLTKRHARMRSQLNQPNFRTLVRNRIYKRHPYANRLTWPLPNVWIGVSVENQQWADIRIPALLETPAAVRWLSCEPLLGPVRLPLLDEVGKCTCAGGVEWPHEPLCGFEPGPAWEKLHWVVAGGESGPGARPMHPGWARDLRDQCRQARVPYFFKQWGEWAPAGRGIGIGEHAHGRQALVGPADDRGFRQVIERVGKKAAGRELDGRTWDEYPDRIAEQVPQREAVNAGA